MKIKVSIGINDGCSTHYQDIMITEEDIIKLAKDRMNELYYGDNTFIHEKIKGVELD